jgi:hypothetical protein
MTRHGKKKNDETGNILLKYVLPVYNLAQEGGGGLFPSGSAYVSLRGWPFDSERDLEVFLGK